MQNTSFRSSLGFIKLFVISLMVLLFNTVAFGQTAGKPTPYPIQRYQTNSGQLIPTEFRCDVLYATEDGYDSNGARRPRIFEINPSTYEYKPVYKFLPRERTYAGQTTNTDIWSERPGNQQFTTIALGKNPVTGKYTMYHWAWSSRGPDVVWTYEGGQAFGTFLSPSLRSVPGNDGNGSFSGGEVFQKTGDIYFSGREDNNLEGNWRMRVVTPAGYDQYGRMKYSRVVDSQKLLPESGGTVLYATNSLGEEVRVSRENVFSDMTFDANGNVYILAGDRENRRFLLKVKPNLNANGSPVSGGWTYSVVREIKLGRNDGDIWGVAFLNGDLYLQSNRRLYKVNVLTGIGEEVNYYYNTPISGKYSAVGVTTPLQNLTSMFDLASCQTAPVVEGAVYWDKNGSGKGKFSSKVAGIDIEIWKVVGGKPVYQSTVKTNELGNYSFLLDSTNSDYYLRFLNLNVDGTPAVQTWAQAGMFGPSSVTSHCLDPAANTMKPKGSAGVCASNSNDAPPRQGNPSVWASYQKISSRSDEYVMDASIAITTASNYGDAPASYNAVNGPSHLSPGVSGDIADEQLNFLRLGDKISIQNSNMPSVSANLIKTHDGVEIAKYGDSNFKSLQDSIVIPGQKYQLKININGALASHAYLSAWLDWTGAGLKTNKFDGTNQIIKDAQQKGDHLLVDYVAPFSTLSTIKNTYARFRVSSIPGVNSVESSTQNKKIYGEVEDYRLYYAPGKISLSVKATGGIGTFNYIFNNIVEGAPSSNQSVIKITEEGRQFYDEENHVFASLNAPVKISQVSPNKEWKLLDVSCTENGRPMAGVDFQEDGQIIIPANYIKAGSDILCRLDNVYAARFQLTKKIIERFDAADQFTIQIKDSDRVVHSMTTSGSNMSAEINSVSLKSGKTYTITEIMAGGSQSPINRYEGSINCTNASSSKTQLPSGEGTVFTVTPMNGDNINCTLTNNTVKPSAKKSNIKAEPAVITADGKMESLITVTVFDVNGKEIKAGGDQVTIDFVDAQNHVGKLIGIGKDNAVIDNGDGTYSIKVVSTKAAVNEEFKFTVNGQEGATTAKVTYVAGNADASTSIIEIDKSSITADGSDSAIVTVTLLDINGNELETSSKQDGERYNVKIHFKNPKNAVGNISSQTRDLGNGKFIATVSSEIAGSDLITFTLDNEKSDKVVEANYVIGKITSETSEISIDKDFITADGLDSATVTVTLLDALGNQPVSSKKMDENNGHYVVKIHFVDDQDSVGAISSETKDMGDGTFTANVTSKNVGSDNITFTLDKVVSSKSVTANYVAGEASLETSTITIDKPSIIANGVDTAQVTVTLLDVNGNKLNTSTKKNGSKYIVNIHFKDVSGAKGILSSKTIDLSKGVFTTFVRSEMVGSDEITFTLDEVVSSKSVTANYVAGEASLETSTITIDKPSIIANGVDTAQVTVTLLDANGNKLNTSTKENGSKYIVNIHFKDASGAKGVLSSKTIDLSKGVFTAFVRSEMVGSDEITFTLDKVVSSKSVTANYVAGEVTSESSAITVEPSSITADGTDFATVTVTLLDVNGNQLPNSTKEDGTKYDVSIHFVDDANKIGSITEFKDNEDGAFTAKVTSTVIGNEEVTFTLDGATSSHKQPITYVAGKASATNSKIEVSKDSIIADGVDKSVVTVTLYDGENNVITDAINPETGDAYVVEIHFVDAAGKVGTLTATNNNNDGTFTAEVTSEKAGADEIDFKLDDVEHTGPVTVTYTPGAANKDASIIAIDPKSIVADGSTEATVTVTLFDANNNQLTTGSDLNGTPYEVVVFSTSAAGETKGVLADSVTNNNDGTFTITLTSTVKGTEVFGFSLNGENSSKTDNVTYTPGEVDLTKSTIKAVPDSVIADGVDHSIITVQLKDAQGNNLDSNIGTVAITGLVLPIQAGDKVAATYVEEGRYELKVTSVKAGLNDNINFEVTVGGAAQAGQGEKASIDFIPGPVDLNQSTITADPTAIVANDDEISTITVQLKDSQGNNLRESKGTVTLIFNDGAGTKGTVTEVVDNNDGTYTATVKSTVANITDKVNFALDGTAASATPTHIQYNPGEVSLEKTTITASPKTIEANGSEESTVTVQLKDAFNNDIKTPLSDGVVTLTSANPIGTIANNGQMSYAGDGKYTVAVTSETTGTEEFGYNISTVGAGVNTESITYRTGGISLTESTFDVTPTEIIANDTDEAIVSVQLLDAKKNKPEEMPGVVYLTGLEKGKTADGSLQMTHIGNGLYQITVKSTVIGVDNLGYEFGETEDSRAAGSAKKDLTYLAGEVDLTKSTIVITPPSITANGQARANVTVQLRDAYENNITENKGTVTLVGLEIGDLLNAENNALVFQGGTYTGIITSTVTGSENVGFTMEGMSETSPTAPITYTPGNVSNSQSEISADPLSIVADDEAFTTITIQLKDGQGNNLESEITSEIALTGVTLGHIAEELHYVDNGVYQATVKSQKAGTDNIGFTIAGNPGQNGHTEAVTYTAGEADLTKSTLSANPEEIVANGTTTSTLTVQLYDKFGNKITEARDNVVVISIKGTSAAEATLTETVKGTNGTYTARVSSQKAGVDNFDFSLDGVQADVADVTVTYVAGAPVAANSIIIANPEEIFADGSVESTLTVQLRDGNNNDLKVSAGDIVRIMSETTPVLGLLSTPIVDNQDGTYSVTVTSTKAGTETFGFSVSDAKSPSKAKVTYLPGVASATTSEISIQPNIITADGDTEAKVTVTLRDINGNKLISDDADAAPVVLTGVNTATEGNIALTYDGGETGTYSGILTSTSEGKDTIGFTLNGVAATGPKSTADLTYRSGGFDLNKSTIELSKSEIVANDSDSSIVTITILDKNGNAVTEDLTIALVGLDTGKLVGSLEKNGNVYTGTITSTKTGNDTIGFTIDGSKATDEKPLSYIAGPYDFSKSSISVNPASIVANDTQTAVVTVQLKDAFDNNLDKELAEKVSLVESTLVNGKSAEANATLDFTYVGDGRYELKVKSTKTGTDNLNYQVGTDANTGPAAALTYAAGPISLVESTIVADPEFITADGVQTSTITVQFKDKFGNDITSNVGNVTLTGLSAPEAHLVGSMRYVAGTGSYTGKVVSTKATTDHIGYVVEGVGNGEKTAELTYTAGEVDIHQSTINATPNTINADGIATSMITVQLRDAKGNIVPSENGIVVLTGLDRGVAVDGSDKPLTLTYVDNGRYQVEVKSTTSGTDTLSFTLDGQQSNSQATLTYKPGQYDLSKSEISVSPPSIEANGRTKSTVTVQLKDKFGNNTEDGAAVNVVLIGLVVGNISNAQLTFGGNGRYTGVITSTKAGSDELSFTVDNKAPTADNAKGKATITYTAGSADASISTITADPRRILADGIATSIITVQLKDSQGNNLKDDKDPSTGQPYTVDLKFVDPQVGVMTPVSGEMNHIGGGAFTLTVSSADTGTDKFTFELNGVTPENKFASVTYYSGAPDATTSTIEAEPTEIAADGSTTSTLTVTLRDAKGNVVDPSKYQEAIKSIVVIAPQETTAGVEVSAVTNNGNGTYTATVKSTVAKTDTFEFTFDGEKGDDTATVKYKTGAVDPTTSTITIEPPSILANGVEEATVTITLNDVNGNTIKENMGEVNLTGLVIGKAAQNDNLVMQADGTYTTTITSILPGDENVGFEVVGSTGTVTGTTAPINYNLIDAKFDDGKSTIIANPVSITADGSDSSTITVTLKHDGKDTPLSGLGIDELTLVSKKAGVDLLGDVVAKGETGEGTGIYTFEVTSLLLGEDQFGFELNGETSTKSASVKYATGGDIFDPTQSTIVIQSKDMSKPGKSADILADGIDKATVIVTLKYKSGAPLIGARSLVLNGVDNGIVSDVLDNQDGTYTFTVVSKENKVVTDMIGFETINTQGTDTVTLNYIGGDIFDPTQSTIVIQSKDMSKPGKSADILADGIDKATVTVTLKYESGTPVIGAGSLVLNGIENGTVSPVTDNQDGTYTFTVISANNKVVTDTIGFETTSTKGTDTVILNYTTGGDIFDPTQSIIVIQSKDMSKPGKSADILADGVDTATVTVTLKYESGAPMIGATSLVLNGVHNGTASSATDNEDGTYTFTVVAKDSTVANLKDTIGFNTTNTKSTDTVTLNYSAGNGDFDPNKSSIVVSPVEINADGSSTAEVTVVLRYANGTPLVGYDGVELVSKSGGYLVGDENIGGPASIDNADGTYVFTVTSKSGVVGTDIFGYKTEARESTNTANLTYVAGTVSAEHSELTINGGTDPVTIKADGEERATVVVTLKDEAGNPITRGVDANGNDYVVTLTGVTTGNSTPATRMTNNGDGTFTAYINSTKASETADTIGFEISGAVGGNTVDLSYVAGEVALANTLIVADPSAIKVSEGDVQSTITATLRDKFNNVITATEALGVTIVVSKDNAGDARTLENLGVVDGKIVATVSSTKATTDSFTVEMAGERATVEAQVRYTPGAASAAHSIIDAQPIEILADGTSKSRVTVQLKDQFGNNLTTQGGNATTVQLTDVLVADGVSATKGRVTASYIANGQFVVDITSTKAGSDVIGFEVNGEVGGTESGKPTTTITYTTGNVDLNQSRFVAEPETIVVSEGENQSTLTITLKDVNGNVIPASDVYTVTVGTVDAAIADSISAVSIDESTGTYKVTVSSTKVGTDTFYYTVDGSASPNLVTVTYTAGAIDLTQSTITTVPSEIAINKAEAIAEQEASIVTVELKDQFGNTVTERAEVALEGLTHGTIRSQRFNTVTGLYTFDVISKDYTEGTDTVIFTANGESATGKEATITYKYFAKGEVSLAKSTIEADPTEIVANGTTTSTLTVTLRDYEGNVVENAEGAVVIIVEGQAIGTLVAGDTGYTATVTSSNVGTDTFGFTYNDAKAADTAVVTYTVGEFDAAQSTLVVAPNPVTANGKDAAIAVVTLKDANGNVIPRDHSPVEMAFVGDKVGTVNNGTNTTFTYLGEGRYTATLTSTVMGTDTIGYTVDAVAGDATKEVRYVAGPVSYEKSEITVSPATIAADGTTEATVTVQLKDAFGNNITADQGTVALTGVALGTAGDVTFNNGVYTATVTSTQVGQDTIGFTLNGVTANDTAVLEYTAGDVDLTKSTLEATPQTDIPANGSASSFVTVTLKDVQGNVVAGDQGTVVLTGINDVEGDAITLTYNALTKRYEGTVSSIIADTYTVGFTLDGQAGTDTKEITFIASGASLLTSSITADPKDINVSRGDITSTITVHLNDAAGNEINHSIGDVVVIRAQGTHVGTLTATTDNGDGTYSATVSSTKAGTDTFTFTILGESSAKTTKVTYRALDVADPKQSTIGTITVAPAIIKADGTVKADVEIILRDEFGNNLEKSPSNFGDIVLAGLEHGTAAEEGLIDNGNGTLSTSITSTVEGDDTVSFTVAGEASASNAPVSYRNAGLDLANSSFEVTPNAIDADGAAEATVTVTLVDMDDKPYIADTVVTLTGLELGTLHVNGGVSNTGILEGSNPLIRAVDSIYTGTITSTKAGADTLSFTVDGLQSGQSQTITYNKVKNLDLGNSDVTLNPEKPVAGDQVVVTIHPKDEDGNPIELEDGETIWVKDPVTGEDVQATGPNADGGYTAVVSVPETAGTDNPDLEITSKDKNDKQTGSTNKPYEVVPGPLDLAKSAITATSPVKADGTETSVVTIQLKDRFENNLTSPIANAISLTGLGNAVVEKTPVYAGNGRYTAEISSLVAKVETISFAISNVGQATDTADVEFTLGAVSITESTIEVLTNPVVADGVATTEVKVTLRDNEGNIIRTNTEEVVIVINGTALGTVGETTRNEDGTYSATLTSPKRITVENRADEVSFTFSGDLSANIATVNYIAGPIDLANTEYVVGSNNSSWSNEATVEANGRVQIYVKVILKDKNKNVVMTNSGQVMLPGLVFGKANSHLLIFDAATGEYRTTVTSTKVGSDANVGILLGGGLIPNKTVTMNYVASAISQDNSTIEVDKPHILADGEDSAIITVTLRDMQNNPIVNTKDIVTLLQTGSGVGVIKPGTEIKGTSDGRYIFTVTSGKPGLDHFNFAFNGINSIQNDVSVTYSTNGDFFDPNQSSISIDKTAIMADGEETATITVSLKYASGLPLVGATTLELIDKGSGENGLIAKVLSGPIDNGDGTYNFIVVGSVGVLGTDTFGYQTAGAVGRDTVDLTYTLQPELIVRLSASESVVKVGDVVMIKADVENKSQDIARNFNVLNTLPGGFSYISGSAVVDSGDAMTVTGDTSLNLGKLNLEAGAKLTLNFIVRVGAGVKSGTNILYSEAFMKRSDGFVPISNKASLHLTVEDHDPLFDDSLIIGTVYHDRNGNGVQDPGEPGIPGVRIVSAEGLIITTDQFGRYHLEDVKGGKWERGRNFILKVDASSLPEGVEFITPNPLVRRITPGLPTRFDFALQLPEESILEVNETMFVQNKARIRSEYERYIPQMIDLINENEIRAITILAKGELGALSQEREEYLQKLLNDRLTDENQIIVGSESQEVEGN